MRRNARRGVETREPATASAREESPEDVKAGAAIIIAIGYDSVL
jgi:hypothetical protein